MDDIDKIREHLSKELEELRQQNARLKESQSSFKLSEEELRKSEEKYRLIIENTSDLIAFTTFTLDPTFTYINHSHKRVMGYTSEDLIGKSGFDFIHPDDKKKLLPLLIKYINKKTGKLLLGKESEISEIIQFRIKDKSGEWHYLESTINIVGDELLFISKDITERKRDEIELKKAYDELEERVEERTATLKAFNEQLKQEITERKLAEERMKDTENRLNNIIESSLDGIIVSDNLGYVIRANKSFLEIVGYAEKEIIGKHIMELSVTEEGIYESTTGELVKINEEFLLLQWETIEKLFEEGKITNWESCYLRKDRKIVPVEANVAYLYNEKGDIIGSVGINRDITERRKTEKEIKETRDFLEKIFKTSADGIIVTDNEGTIIMINEAIEKMLGYSGDELIGKGIGEFGLKDKKYIEEGEKIMAKLMEGGAITGVERVWTRKDGNLVNIEVNSSLLKDEEGNITGAVGSIRDITKRKNVEREIKEARDFLENVISTSVDGIIITDPKGVIIRVNEAVENMTGYTQEELKKMHISQLGYHRLSKDMDRLFKEGMLKAFEEMWKRKDGELLSLELNAALLKNREGEMMGGVVGVRDISERKKIQEIEMKDTFISNISHEFRTPLTLSIGPLEGLLRGEYGDIGKGAKDQIGLALRNNRRQLKLVNQLLEFTRLGSKTEDVSYYRKDINQFLSAIADSFAFLAKKKDIKLNFIPAKGIEPVYIDPEKMERVLLNIIGNAFKFTPRGGNIIIDVKNGKEEMEGNLIKISVRDTGIGIRKEDLPHVFERFQQADGSSSRRHEGTGIGLSLAKELIELQEGKIEVESEYGRGSTFTIYLPMGKDHISDQSQISEERDEIMLTQKEIELSDLGYDEIKIKEEKPTGERPLILFIDDNLDVRRYVTGILSKEYEVITAEDGLKGLEKLKAYVPDLIISDIMMPRMDGYQFCKSVKSNPEIRHIPLIFLTAKADTELKIESLEEGADDYIVKPFNSQELLARVKSMLRIQELIRENIVKEKKIAELTEVLGERHHYHNLIGKSQPMQEIYRLLEKIKDTESPVLISGETGTGKELVAHAIQKNSKRKDHPFIILNCTAISKNLLESELFGHIKGAFTGAVANKKGIFEIADGGTLFLDEIAEMGLATQVELLRVLEEGTFRPVGSSEEKKVSVRVIAATNKDLRKLINKGRFREDLYYRINVININLPPLRERREDIPLLVEHFIKESNGKKGDKKKLSEKALRQLMGYSYPGNVRELKNIIERALMLCESNLISYKDLKLEVRRDTKEDQAPSNDRGQELTLESKKERMERETILEVLKQVKGNKLKAARLLNISRSTLYAKIEKYHIEC